MRTPPAATLLTFLLFSFVPSARAFNEPPVNLSLTSVLDGGPVMPGLYLVEYAVAVHQDQASDKDGNVIPGGAKVDSVTNTHQLVYISDQKIGGANLGVDFVQSVIGITSQGTIGSFPITSNLAGLGDFVFGPILQWNQGTLGGAPFVQRVEFDVTMPTGRYDKSFAANPGSNMWVFEPYYGFTWFFAPGWETSWRLIYTASTKNPDTQIKPGALLHANYAFSYGVTQKWRIGAAGYALQQLGDDQSAGADSPDSKERAIALGPAIGYAMPGLGVFLNHPFEFGTRNRLRSARTTLQLIIKF